VLHGGAALADTGDDAVLAHGWDAGRRSLAVHNLSGTVRDVTLDAASDPAGRTELFADRRYEDVAAGPIGGRAHRLHARAVRAPLVRARARRGGDRITASSRARVPLNRRLGSGSLLASTSQPS
jgi:hypothetical protein